MPTSKDLSTPQKKKLDKIYAICNASRKKYNLSDAKYERCLMGLSKRMNIKKEMKDDIKVQKDCKCMD